MPCPAANARTASILPGPHSVRPASRPVRMPSSVSNSVQSRFSTPSRLASGPAWNRVAEVAITTVWPRRWCALVNRHASWNSVAAMPWTNSRSPSSTRLSSARPAHPRMPRSTSWANWSSLRGRAGRRAPCAQPRQVRSRSCAAGVSRAPLPSSRRSACRRSRRRRRSAGRTGRYGSPPATCRAWSMDCPPGMVQALALGGPRVVGHRDGAVAGTSSVLTVHGHGNPSAIWSIHSSICALG